jgi:hypothetical protein
MASHLPANSRVRVVRRVVHDGVGGEAATVADGIGAGLAGTV